jgi:hypothetical protein
MRREGHAIVENSVGKPDPNHPALLQQSLCDANFDWGIPQRLRCFGMTTRWV